MAFRFSCRNTSIPSHSIPHTCFFSSQNLEDKDRRIVGQLENLKREQRFLQRKLEQIGQGSYRLRQERSISECSTGTTSSTSSLGSSIGSSSSSRSSEESGKCSESLGFCDCCVSVYLCVCVRQWECLTIGAYVYVLVCEGKIWMGPVCVCVCTERERGQERILARFRVVFFCCVALLLGNKMPLKLSKCVCALQFSFHNR